MNWQSKVLTLRESSKGGNEHNVTVTAMPPANLSVQVGIVDSVLRRLLEFQRATISTQE